MTNLPQLQKDLRELLIVDMDAVLQTAKSVLPESTPKAKQVLLLLAKQADLKKSIARGIIAQADIDLNTNQIRSSLLDLIESLTARDFEVSTGTLAAVTATAPKFVVVYDQADQAVATQLNRHLNVLKLTGKLKVYNVNDDKGGENTLERAKQEWANADYMLALITVNLFNSPEWFGMVYDALGEGRRVIPIRIQRADYDGTGLEKLRSLPTQNRAVSDFANADEAYTDIVTEIRRLLPKG
jgi:Effector-associated domain 11